MKTLYRHNRFEFWVNAVFSSISVAALSVIWFHTPENAAPWYVAVMVVASLVWIALDVFHWYAAYEVALEKRDRVLDKEYREMSEWWGSE